MSEQMTVERAKAAICEILAQLEIDENANVESISLRGMDMTRLKSPRAQVLMDVEIELRRRPGHQWTIAGSPS